MEINDYLAFCREKGLSPHTIAAYRVDLLAFEKWLSAHGGAGILTPSEMDVTRYMKALRKQKKSAPTIARSISSLRGFYKWGRKKNIVFLDPFEKVKSVKVIRKTPVIPGNDDIEKLLALCDRTSPKGMRDYSMISCVLCGGMNVSELLSMKLCDVSLGRKVSVRYGSDRRETVLPKEAAEGMREYLQKARPLLLGPVSTDALFVTSKGSVITRQGFWKNLRSYSATCGIEPISPETLRHAFAVSMLSGGRSPEELMKRLGLKSHQAVSEYMELAKA